jgi:hypothetical protein
LQINYLAVEKISKSAFSSANPRSRVRVDDRTVLAVAPCPEDVIVSKLARLSEKDKEFVEAYHGARPLNLELIVERVNATDMESELKARSIAYVTHLVKGG